MPLAARVQSLLYWRKSLFDPDRLFNWLEPRLRFVWTRRSWSSSLAGIALAAVVFLANRSELVSALPTPALGDGGPRLADVVAAPPPCHEFAHGLTCKHYGGEVHEVGFLLMFFMPCFYCNVSDAWLFREKSKRLLGHPGRRVLRPVPVGAGRVRLAADAAGRPAELPGLGGAVGAAASGCSSTSTRC